MNLPLYLLLILITSSIFSASSFETYEYYRADAHAWAMQVVSKEPDHAVLVALLSFLHTSYMRSFMTLKVQRDYLAFFKTIGDGWIHIINTRRNPSKDESFDIQSIIDEKAIHNHQELFKTMCLVQKQYSETLNRLTINSHLKKTVDAIREQARTIVAESLVSVLGKLEDELKHAHSAIIDAADIFKNKRSFSELLWHYLPGFMMTSFVDFDKSYATSSKACFDAYLDSQHISTVIWERIEIPRALFYAMHYQALMVECHNIIGDAVADLPPSDFFINDMKSYVSSSYYAQY